MDIFRVDTIDVADENLNPNPNPNSNPNSNSNSNQHHEGHFNFNLTQEQIEQRLREREDRSIQTLQEMQREKKERRAWCTQLEKAEVALLRVRRAGGLVLARMLLLCNTARHKRTVLSCWQWWARDTLHAGLLAGMVYIYIYSCCYVLKIQFTFTFARSDCISFDALRTFVHVFLLN
jgi:hypothetical protein